MFVNDTGSFSFALVAVTITSSDKMLEGSSINFRFLRFSCTTSFSIVLYPK